MKRLCLCCLCFFVLLEAGFCQNARIAEYTLNMKDAKKNDSGYGIAVYINKITAQGLARHKLMIGAWIKKGNGDYEGYVESELITVNGDNFTYSQPVRIFWYDTYLIDLFGYGGKNLTIAMGLYDRGVSGDEVDYPVDWKEIPFSIALEDRGAPPRKSSEADLVEERGTWDPDGTDERFEPMVIDGASKPSGDVFFSFTHGLSIFPDHQRKAVSIFYTANGSRMLVSDDHATLYLFDINSKSKIWEYTVFADTPFELYIDAVSPDGTTFLTTSRLQRVNGDTAVNVHSMQNGRVIRSIREKSTYYLEIKNPAFPEFDESEDLRGEEMIAWNAQFYNNGNDILVVYRNFKMTHGMFDLSLKCYDFKTWAKKWEWQIIDPRGIDRKSARHFALRFLPVPGRYADFYLFSETGEVRYLSYETIKQAQRIEDIGRKPHGDLLWTFEEDEGRYPQFFAETGGKKGEYYTAIVDEDGLGRLAIIEVETGRIVWESAYESKITGMTGKGAGRYLFARSGSYWNVWDTKTKYLVAAGPHFYQSSFGMLAIHPTRREFAVCFENYIYFLTEKRKARIPLSSRWEPTGIFIDEDAEINGYADGDIQLCLSPELTFSDGESRYARSDDFIVHAGGPYEFDKFYLERHPGRELYVKSDEGSFLELWGGFDRAGFSQSLQTRRNALPGW